VIAVTICMTRQQVHKVPIIEGRTVLLKSTEAQAAVNSDRYTLGRYMASSVSDKHSKISAAPSR
jgi:hypothetical protein